jgi:serine/threonine protein kinase
VLQIIAGLSSQRIGILHRHQALNCFRDTDGSVKISDFGLSISTTVTSNRRSQRPARSSARRLSALGTTARRQLNARSDMYSVGATLLPAHGAHPFEAKNMVQLLATVLEQRAPSPRKFRANIPPGLARVISRCLEKQPGDRFRTYQEIAQALAPYSSSAPTPATLGLRFAAGALDIVVVVWSLCSSCFRLEIPWTFSGVSRAPPGWP